MARLAECSSARKAQHDPGDDGDSGSAGARLEHDVSVRSHWDGFLAAGIAGVSWVYVWSG